VTNVEIAVDGDLTGIANGMHAQFRVYATIGSAADTYEVTDQVTWEGIDGLGDIDAHGLFTATTVGATDAIATYRDVTSDPYFFEVTDAIVDSIEIIPANPMILNVDTKEFTAKAILSDGTEIAPLDASDLTWSSSDDTICAIDADGIATPAADKWGQVVISVSYEDPNTGDTYDAETTLSIGDAMAVNSLTISAVEPADAVTVAMGDKVRYQAIATVGTNNQEFEVTGLVDWSVEGDAIGSIDELGWLEPVAAGTATISAQLTIDNLSGSQTVDSDNDLILEVTD
nr:hypothetical protein [bacterium]